ncbi:MAG: hypothetical protein WCF85_09435 [Rhodospirillaceae bacterium]
MCLTIKDALKITTVIVAICVAIGISSGVGCWFYIRIGNIDWDMASKVTTTIAAILASFGIVIALTQAVIARGSMLADHERSRRQLAIDLVWKWSTALQPESKPIRDFISGLDADQCRSINEGRPFLIDSNKKGKLISCLRKQFPEIEAYINDKIINSNNGHIVLEEGHIRTLRSHAVLYLNLLETVLASWRHNVADSDILEEQFNYLMSSDNESHATLDKFRSVVGIKHFPSIEKFLEHLKLKNAPLEGKPRTA